MECTTVLLGAQLLATARDQLEHAARELARRGESRHGGIHQARKALRRARATLALGARKLGERAQRLDADIGQLGRGLSALRDAQALVETLERLRHSEPDLHDMLPAAVAAGIQHRNALLERSLQRDADFQSRRKRIAQMLRRLQRLDWSAVREPTVSKALTRSARRIDRAQAAAEQNPHHQEAWHRLRRRVRRLRQQHGIVDAIAPDLHAHVPHADPRAETLGEAQDDALLLARCNSHSPFSPAQRKVLRAVARRRLARLRL